MNLTKEELIRAKDLIKSILDDLRPELMESYGKIEYTDKHDESPVTVLDVKVEETLKKELANKFPGIGFSGEEGGVDYEQETFWLVDPIDGTSSFIRGLPYCSNMISLINNGSVILGIIYNFVADEFYWAVEGGGAFCNDVPISVSTRDKAFLYLESKSDNDNNKIIRTELENKGYFMLDHISAGHFATHVASGKVEGTISHNPYGFPYDFAPGALLIKEAGGTVKNIGKDDYSFTDVNFVATNKTVFEDLKEFFDNAE